MATSRLYPGGGGNATSLPDQPSAAPSAVRNGGQGQGLKRGGRRIAMDRPAARYYDQSPTNSPDNQGFRQTKVQRAFSLTTCAAGNIGRRQTPVDVDVGLLGL